MSQSTLVFAAKRHRSIAVGRRERGTRGSRGIPQDRTAQRCRYAFLALLLLASNSGCAFNSAPIHANLSDEELRAAVRARFEIGQPVQQVKDKLKDAGLGYSFERRTSPCTQERQRLATVARVRPSGLHTRLWYSNDGTLAFFFDDEDMLNCVEYTKPQSWKRGDPPEVLLP